jgi:hypothetical protein
MAQKVNRRHGLSRLVLGAFCKGLDDTLETGPSTGNDSVRPQRLNAPLGSEAAL